MVEVGRPQNPWLSFADIEGAIVFCIFKTSVTFEYALNLYPTVTLSSLAQVSVATEKSFPCNKKRRAQSEQLNFSFSFLGEVDYVQKRLLVLLKITACSLQGKSRKIIRPSYCLT